MSAGFDGLPATGGCQCGAVRFELWDDPETTYVCHCTDCRKQSGSAFGISLIMRGSALKVTSGEPRLWQRATDKGNLMDCWFCPDCGTRLWHRSSGFPDFRSVKGGALDQPIDLSAAVHLFTGQKLSGVEIPDGALCFAGEPE